MSTYKKPWKMKKIEKLKEKEYSRPYLKQKQERHEEPNNYPFSRLILIKDFFRTPDLYLAVGFFFGVQIIIAILSASTNNPTYAGALNLLAILLGLVTIGFTIHIINKRQRFDPTRRKFRVSRVLAIVSVMFLAIMASSYVLSLVGINMSQQPNQTSLETLLTQFPVAMIFTMVMVSPFAEELVFRELLPFATGPSYVSFVLASLIFIALHAPFGLMGWMSYGILSAGFLYARLRDNNIYTAIGVHVVWNLLTIIL